MLFQSRTWTNVQVLLVGAVLSPGKRTVTSALRVMGLSGDGNFARYHHVLNRASWSPLKLSRVLLYLLLGQLDAGTEPLVFGIDEKIERRRPQHGLLALLGVQQPCTEDGEVEDRRYNHQGDEHDGGF